MIEFDTERDPIDVLAEEFAQRYRQGERPSVGDYTSRYPQWAGELRALLPSVAKMEQWKCYRQATSVCLASGAAPEKIGDYRILREIGRGGMGIVFEAAQESLGRRVALKILPGHSLLDRKRLERFQREAQAAARLHHTNIVQVFGVGEQDGLHYYVMQFIEGKGLNELLAQWRRVAGISVASPAAESTQDEIPDHEQPKTLEGAAPPTAGLPTAVCCRDLARIGMQTADALHYAHEHGVIHRDLKPANILLQKKFESRGTKSEIRISKSETNSKSESKKSETEPVSDISNSNFDIVSDFGFRISDFEPTITDFGLAKLSDRKDLTQTGDILGTVGYMAPECFHGQADARSDIYALGLTLYELLTLRPPFPETNPARLIRQVSEQEPLRPRKLNPAIPRDLETVVLKAIAREPERRYATAQAMAEDLARFLDDRPILARRITAPERLWHWCRRNRALATLAGIALACFILAAVVGWVGYVHTRRALDGESLKAAEAKEATELAEANVKLSLEHFEEIFDRLADKAAMPPGKFGFGKYPKVSEEDVALLNSILGFYGEFAERNTTNPRLQLEAARAQRRVGDIHRRLNQADKAATAYRRAAATLEQLDQRFPAESRYRQELVQTYLLEDVSAGSQEQLREAEERLTRAVNLAQQLAAATPTSSRHAAILARSHARLAGVQQQRSNFGAAEDHYRQAIAIQETLLQKSPLDFFVAFDLASARLNLADCLLAKDQPVEARALLEESIKNLKGNSKDDARFRGRGGLLSSHYQKLATVLTRLGETDLAAEATRNAARYRQSFFRGRP